MGLPFLHYHGMFASRDAWGCSFPDDDPQSNEKFAKRHNSSGTYVHPFNKQRVRFFSIAMTLAPHSVVTLSATALRVRLCEAFLEELDRTTVKVPKGFAFERFVAQLKLALEIYKRAEIPPVAPD